MSTNIKTSTWNPTFSVGDAVLDSHHKKLFEMVDELTDAITAGTSKEALAKLVDGLQSYTALHFKAEEEAMAKAGFPALPSHRKLHEDFVAKVKDLRERFAAGRLVLTIEVTNFCRKWITEHILGVDKQYAPFLKRK